MVSRKFYFLCFAVLVIYLGNRGSLAATTTPAADDNSTETETTTSSTTVTTTTLAPSTLAPSTDERTASSAGVYIKTLGHSGKIMVGRNKNPALDKNRITVEFDDLREKDSLDKDVGCSGKDKHCFRTFANQNFQFSDKEETTYQNLSVVTFSFNSELGSLGATLKVQVFIFTEAGVITVDDENTTITDGNVKFNIELYNWTFCGPEGVSCKKGGGGGQGQGGQGQGGQGGQGQGGQGGQGTDIVGEYLDFTIVIKGKGTPQKSKGNSSSETDGDEYTLGDGASVILSKKIEIDGEWKDMANDYPKLVTQGAKQKFILRFPKFTSSAVYDPVLAASSTYVPEDVGLGVRQTPCLLAMIFTLLACILIQKM